MTLWTSRKGMIPVGGWRGSWKPAERESSTAFACGEADGEQMTEQAGNGSGNWVGTAAHPAQEDGYTVCLLVKEHNTVNSPAHHHLLRNPSRCNYQFTRHKQTNMLNDTRLTVCKCLWTDGGQPWARSGLGLGRRHSDRLPGTAPLCFST